MSGNSLTLSLRMVELTKRALGKGLRSVATRGFSKAEALKDKQWISGTSWILKCILPLTLPSAYWAGVSLLNALKAIPHSLCSTLLQEPSKLRYLVGGQIGSFGHKLAMGEAAKLTDCKANGVVLSLHLKRRNTS